MMWFRPSWLVWVAAAVTAATSCCTAFHVGAPLQKSGRGTIAGNVDPCRVLWHYRRHYNGRHERCFGSGAVNIVAADVGTGCNNHPITSMMAKPNRLEENVSGVLYVNDACIHCAACSVFCPDSFKRNKADTAHIVHTQPDSSNENHIDQARAALAACPVAAIRVENFAERKHKATTAEDRQAVIDSWSEEDAILSKSLSLSPAINGGREKPFPRPFLDDVPDVYWLGHHNEHSFGATPYLIKAIKPVSNEQSDDPTSNVVWIMVDTPKFGPSAVQAVTSLTGPHGPDYLFLTHVDDTADHNKWKLHFGDHLNRIFHAGDLGGYNWLNDRTLEHVEILLPNTSMKSKKEETMDPNESMAAFDLDGNVVNLQRWMEVASAAGPEGLHEVIVLHTPGHSPGSISLYRSDGVLFTGDTYAYSTRGGGRMTGFPRYGNDLSQQAMTLQKLRDQLHLWQAVAPGHGHPRDYRSWNDLDQRTAAVHSDMEVALSELVGYRVRRR